MEKLDKSIRTGAGTLVELNIVLKLNEIVEWANEISKRIGLMEDEYKQHLYGPGYKWSSEQHVGGRKE